MSHDPLEKIISLWKVHVIEDHVWCGILPATASAWLELTGRTEGICELSNRITKHAG